MGQEKRGIDFVRSKTKGTIAEIIFQYMFAEHDFATVIPFGYEHLAPTIAQYQHLLDTATEINDIRNTPDFLLIKPDNKHAALVDVKYRRRKDPERIKEIAVKIHKRWETTWIFLATLDGFFFAPCSVIIANNGDIPRLPTHWRWIPQDTQDTYFRLLWVAIQSLSQLETVYGKARAQTLRDNMESQLYYRPTDLATVTYLEQRLGSVSAYAHSYTLRDEEEIGEGRVELPISLLSAQQILQLPDEEILAFHRKLPPIRLARMDWREHPELTKRRSLTPPQLPTLAPVPEYTFPKRKGRKVRSFLDLETSN